eukprot:TRINITY_DN4600_c0_g1_i2.p1 TRINITY_DN4600_c0_g1~~TRINITY_DN4600_c0_g1_i2.p1  ORF type:complete len:338 (-),score=54.93 TRINITY_DN4600_c0_g1_i2:99-1112(-)
MPQLGIIFEIGRAHTVSGEGIRVVGNVPELGAWDPDAASALRAGVTTYPRWIMSAPLWLEVRESEAVERPPPGVACAGAPSGGRAERYVVLEYKYLKERAALGQPVLWEDAIPNRRVALPFPADGGRSRVWHVSDDAWNSAAGSTRIVPTTLGEVLSTRETLDPEESARMRQPGATWIPQLETRASRASSPVREVALNSPVSCPKSPETPCRRRFSIENVYDTPCLRDLRADEGAFTPRSPTMRRAPAERGRGRGGVNKSGDESPAFSPSPRKCFDNEMPEVVPSTEELQGLVAQLRAEKQSADAENERLRERLRWEIEKGSPAEKNRTSRRHSMGV